MPQIEQVAATFASQLFWVVLTFGLAYLVIGRGMVPRVQATMDDRDTQVAGDLKAAEAARAAADADEEDWRAKENAAREAARQKLAAAKAAGAARTEGVLASANARHAAHVAEAEARIAASADTARGEIEGVAADLARDIVARLSGVPVSEDEARGAVRAVIHG